jgi:tetratricopeptide (TPR) repeat protein
VIAASRQDNAKAEAEYLRALALQPSQPSALRGLAILYRYQGKLDEAAEQLLRAAVLDPRDLSAQYDLGVTYQRLRRYEEAERFLERAIALNPSDANPLVRLAILKLMRAGDVAGARQALARTSDPFDALIRMTSLVLSAEMRVVLCDACEGAAASRLRALGPVPRDSVADPAAWLWRGHVAQLAGQPAVARAAFDSALQRTKRQVDSVPGARSDFSAQRSLTEVAALAGRRDVALQAARETVRLLQATPNGTWGPDAMNIAAEVFAKFGEDSAALENLDRALTLPSHVTVALVRLNPVWARFKGVPAFEQMLARH